MKQTHAITKSLQSPCALRSTAARVPTKASNASKAYHCAHGDLANPMDVLAFLQCRVAGTSTGTSTSTSTGRSGRLCYCYRCRSCCGAAIFLPAAEGATVTATATSVLIRCLPCLPCYACPHPAPAPVPGAEILNANANATCGHAGHGRRGRRGCWHLVGHDHRVRGMAATGSGEHVSARRRPLPVPLPGPLCGLLCDRCRPGVPGGCAFCFFSFPFSPSCVSFSPSFLSSSCACARARARHCAGYA